MLPVVGLSFALVASATQVASPCDLLGRAAVSEDEDTGGTLSYCTYQAGPMAVIVSQVTFGSAAAARKATTKELVAGRLQDGVTALTEEPGSAIGPSGRIPRRGRNT